VRASLEKYLEMAVGYSIPVIPLAPLVGWSLKDALNNR
jgi:hypothetical protein